MGIFSEYVDRSFSTEGLNAERKAQLKRVAEIRSRDVLVYAADMNKPRAPISIEYADLLPISDQLSNLSGEALDLIIESPGGSGEVAEDIVGLLHQKYRDIAVIVPGWAKSAATLITMAGHEILMEPASALGPIDAQIQWGQGKVFSADALIEGMEKIKDEVDKAGRLNRAYIPILQNLSPGELQSAQNALDFAKRLVRSWLANHKFRDWTARRTSGQAVSQADRESRAAEIAGELCNHRKWLTHGRSIKIQQLEAMGLRITDYSQQADLADAIRRYYTLLNMTFASNIYKVFETPTSQIFRLSLEGAGPIPVGPAAAPGAKKVESAEINIGCGKCGKQSKLQANLDATRPIAAGALPFPADNKFSCPNCGNVVDLADLRRQIEAQTGGRVVA